jgi:hypothetical protein
MSEFAVNHDVPLKMSHTSRPHIKTWRAERGSGANIVIVVAFIVLLFVHFGFEFVIYFLGFFVVDAPNDEGKRYGTGQCEECPSTHAPYYNPNHIYIPIGHGF